MKKEYIKPAFNIYEINADAIMQVVNNSITDQEQLSKDTGGGSTGGSSMWEWMEE